MEMAEAKGRVSVIMIETPSTAYDGDVINYR
jgi:hypothetical protein